MTVERVATDFGVHPMTLWKWMRRADIDDGAKGGSTRQENAELREARRRIKLLEQENEVLRRAAAYLSQAHLPGKDLPAREGAGRGRNACRGDVPGAEARQAAVLPLARQAGGRRRPR
ncbi:transposase [Streptomyces sp. A0592]|uniref:transposase n=1 Tax=Streptomyces sp. A0592 TaxID=2563099 RepID=UPI001F0D9201|nr:transposase [Streptomyces sp. A0592]